MSKRLKDQRKRQRSLEKTHETKKRTRDGEDEDEVEDKIEDEDKIGYDGGDGGFEDVGGDGGFEDAGDDVGDSCLNSAWSEFDPVINDKTKKDLVSKYARRFLRVIEDVDANLDRSKYRKLFVKVMNGLSGLKMLARVIHEWVRFQPVPSSARMYNSSGTPDLSADGYVSHLLRWGNDNRESMKNILFGVSDGLGAELSDKMKTNRAYNCSDEVNIVDKAFYAKVKQSQADGYSLYHCSEPRNMNTSLFEAAIPVYSARQMAAVYVPNMPVKRVRAVQKAFDCKLKKDLAMYSVIQMWNATLDCALKIRESSKKRRILKFFSREKENPLAQFIAHPHDLDLEYKNDDVSDEAFEGHECLDDASRMFPYTEFGEPVHFHPRHQRFADKIKEGKKQLNTHKWREHLAFEIENSSYVNIYRFAAQVQRMLGIQPVRQSAKKMNVSDIDVSEEGYLGSLCDWGSSSRVCFYYVYAVLVLPSFSDEVSAITEKEVNACCLQKINIIQKFDSAMVNVDFKKHGTLTPSPSPRSIFLWHIPKYSAKAAMEAGESGAGISPARVQAMQQAWQRKLWQYVNSNFIQHFFTSFVHLAEVLREHKKVYKAMKKLSCGFAERLCAHAEDEHMYEHIDNGETAKSDEDNSSDEGT